MKRPAFQFYPADWRKDSALQSCSLAAQGLWINAMCIAHECEPYGHLAVNGKAMLAPQLARLVGLTSKECGRLLDELESAGVFSRTEEGAVYSRRMVGDERLRNIRAEGGKAGAEHGIKGKEHGHKGGRPAEARGDIKPPLEPPPSSSSSSSTTEKTKAKSLTLPDWLPLDSWEAWLEVRGKAGAPNTPRALTLAIKELGKLRDQGHDPRALLDEATLRGWKKPYASKSAAPVDAFKVDV